MSTSAINPLGRIVPCVRPVRKVSIQASGDGGRSIIDITLKPDQEAGDVFSQDDLDVLAHVAEENRRGKLLVTNATRLLDLTALEETWSGERKQRRTGLR